MSIFASVHKTVFASNASNQQSKFVAQTGFLGRSAHVRGRRRCGRPSRSPPRFYLSNLTPLVSWLEEEIELASRPRGLYAESENAETIKLTKFCLFPRRGSRRRLLQNLIGPNSSKHFLRKMNKIHHCSAFRDVAKLAAHQETCTKTSDTKCLHQCSECGIEFKTFASLKVLLFCEPKWVFRLPDLLFPCQIGRIGVVWKRCWRVLRLI